MLQNTKLTNVLRKIVKSNAEVEDIILFGSTVRGKVAPKDIDILVLFKTVLNKKIELEIRKAIEKYYKNVSIISKTHETVLDPAFDARESILFEGMSIVDKTLQSTKHGFSSVGMFRYDFKNWNKLMKTKFYYAFNGRGTNPGISTKLECTKLSESIIVVPLHNIEPFRDFIEFWKLEYRYIPLLLPQRLNKKNLLTVV